MPVKRVRNSAPAGSGEAGRRWLKRVLMGACVGGIRRTRRPDEMVGQSLHLATKNWIDKANRKQIRERLFQN